MADTLLLLYVDDEALVGRALARALKRRGFDVVAVLNGDEARAAMAQQRFDLVVCDYRLAGESGLVLVEELGRLQPQAVRVLTSAAIDTEAMRGPMDAAGVEVFLAKPWEMDAAAAQLRAAWAKRQAN